MSEIDDFREEMRQVAAEVVTEVDIEMGELVTYQHRALTPIKCRCMPTRNSATRMRETLGARVVEETKTFEIPYSELTFLNTEDPFPDDTITDSRGYVFAVHSIKPDDDDCIYRFEDCVNTTPKQSGNVGQ